MNKARKYFFNFSRYVLTAGLLIVFSSSTGTFQNVDTNTKMKALYVYQFTKYFEWPSSYKEGKFIIGILGNSPLYAQLKSDIANKRVGSQEIEIANFSSTAGVSKCHMLIIPPDLQTSFNDILNKIKNQSTLLITEKSGMAKQGAAINFTVKNNRPVFEVNKSNAEKYSLKVSSTLLPLAIVVE